MTHVLRDPDDTMARSCPPTNRPRLAELGGGRPDLRLRARRRSALSGDPLRDGPTLFPDQVADWLALREQAERLVCLRDVVAVAPSRVDGAQQRRSPSSRRSAIDLREVRAAAHDRALEEAASLVEAARATALDALGGTDGVATIAERRLQLKAEPRQCL